MSGSGPTIGSLDQYELIDRIGSGGMAEVFRAKARGVHGFEKVVAIKRILPARACDPHFQQQFIAEAKLMVSLSHENTVQVFDFGRFGESLYIVMEYVDGLDLAALMRARRTIDRAIPVGAALHVGTELCLGLGFLHHRSVIHRDVSPSNILLSRAGAVKVADFGIAETHAPLDTTKSPGPIMGKWAYMSPEQTYGRPLDARSDVFSAGIVIYEMLSQQRLFPGDTPSEIALEVREKPIPPISLLRAELPASLDAVLARALDRDPARRYSHAADLGRALIEVSYAHRLVASALDVAELVEQTTATSSTESVGPRAVLVDEIIRSELGLSSGNGSRLTATQHSEVLFVRGPAEADGISRWRLEATQLLPPVESAPPATNGRRSLLYALLSMVALGTAAFALASRSERREPAPRQSWEAPLAGSILVESEPPGAMIRLDGTAASSRSPTLIEVDPARLDQRHSLEVELPGHRPFRDDSVTVRRGERLVYRPRLEPWTARLTVRSVPPGAEVSIDGRALGATPLDVGDVPADGGVHRVRVTKPAHRDQEREVTLTDGSHVRVDVTLEPAVRYGTIDLYSEPWAEVYLDNRKIAEAPVRGLRLPHGRHRLRLVNPVLGRETTRVVKVPADGPYRVQLP